MASKSNKHSKNPLHPIVQSILDGARPSLDEFLDALAPTFPLLNQLEATPQDSEWHAEGNVKIHTGMVLAETYRILDREQSFSKKEQLILTLSALFHDVAKTISTKTRWFDDRERIVSPGHADKGRSYIAYKLLDLGLSPELARTIMAVVGHHHDPKRLVKDDIPDSKYYRLARLAPLHLLYWLEQADLRGRTCSDTEEQLDILDLFKLRSEEIGLWQNCDPYCEWQTFIQNELGDFSEQTQDFILQQSILDYEDSLIHTPHEAVARSYNYRDNYANLTIVCGPSGSGKSTWIADTLPDYEIVSLDQIRRQMTGNQSEQSKNGQVTQLAKEQLKEALRKKRNVVWDATTLMLNHRSAITSLGFSYKACVNLAVFHKPESLIFSQNKEREHAIPTSAVTKQLRNANFPYLDEAHFTTYVSGELN